MTLYDIGNIFKFAGGIGLFLYGMSLLSNALKVAASEKIGHFVNIITGKRITAVLAGAVITALIQSSSAATVMVVGMVNAGIINLIQAAGVIMGANIGTTITSWLVSIGQFGETLKIFSPSFFAPLLIAVGAFIKIFSDKKGNNNSGDIICSFGFLFTGLDFMSSAFSSYADSPVIADLFAVLGKNPLLGILAGAAVTAVLQSSSASIGILQSLAMTGAVNFGAAVFITLGQNIGSCVTSLISGIGAHRTAKRAAVIHLLFNLLGTAIFGGALYIYFRLFNGELAGAGITSVQISIFHTLFNVLNTLILFPFAGLMVKISGIIVRDKENDKEETEDIVELCVKRLDRRILGSPSLAVDNVLEEIAVMGEIAGDNVRRALEVSMGFNKENTKAVYSVEKDIDRMQSLLTEYLIKISNRGLSLSQSEKLKDYICAINDFERIGDHAENIAELAEYMDGRRLEFSRTGLKDLEEIGGLVSEAIDNVVALLKHNSESRQIVEKLENEVDRLEIKFREKHVERLTRGECSVEAGVIFLDIVSNLERICDHCHNIAGYSSI